MKTADDVIGQPRVAALEKPTFAKLPTRPHLLPFDIETRSTVDLGDVGPDIYATHPTTDVRGLAYCVDDGPIKMWHKGDPVPREFIIAAKNINWVGVAHNAAFDHKIMKYILAPRHHFPIIPIERMICTMAIAHANALPGKLERVAKVLKLEHQKDSTGARVQLQMAKPRRPRKGEDPNGVYYFDDPEKHAISDDSCMKDVAAMRDLYQSFPGLSSEEMQVWLLDQRINDRGFYLDQELAEAACKIAEAANPVINTELTEITDGEVTAFTQVARLTKWLKQYIDDIDTLNKDALEELLELDLPKNVRRVLELRYLGAQAAVAKVDALLQRRCPDGRVRGSFVYHAAGTGRWSSRGAQVHNLKRSLTEDIPKAVEIIGRGDFEHACQTYDNPLSVIGDLIRAMIRAAPGHTLIGCDFSGIEARVTAWLADEQSKLDVFRAYDAGRGPDPYIIAAAAIFNIDAEQLAADYKTGQPAARELRQTGKAAELAFGYQGGVRAYRKFVPDTPLPDREIDKIKFKWRAKHPNIERFWGSINRAAWHAVRHPGDVVRCGKIMLECDDAPFLRLTLPSGRELAYPHARIIKAYTPSGTKLVIEPERGQPSLVCKDNSAGRWRDERVYGGLLTENVVQGIARDLLAEAMLRMDIAKLDIVTHTHDECVAEVPKKDIARIKSKFTKLMTNVPEWGKGIPIVATSWVSERYLK